MSISAAGNNIFTQEPITSRFLDVANQNASSSVIHGVAVIPTRDITQEVSKHVRAAFTIAHDGSIIPDNDNSTTLTDIWNATDTSGMGALVMALQPARSLDNTIKAIKALIDQGEPERALTLLEKVVDRYDAKGKIDRVLYLLEEHGLSDLVTLEDDLTPNDPAVIAQQLALEEEPDKQRRLLLDQAPKFGAF